MFVEMGASEIRKADFFVKTKGHCFLCLEQVSSHPTLVKLDPDSDGLLDAFPPVPVLHHPHSLQYLSHYLKLDLGAAVVDDNEIMTASQQSQSLKAKLRKSRLKAELCEACGTLNERFLELYQQLERIHMEVTHCLGSIHEKLTKGKEPATNKSLNKEELDILEALRKDAKRKCSSKLKRTVPRVQTERLTVTEENLQQQHYLEVVKTSSIIRDSETDADCELGPIFSVKLEVDSAASPQLDIELMNMEVEKKYIPELETEATTILPSSSSPTNAQAKADHEPEQVSRSADVAGTNKLPNKLQERRAMRSRVKRNPNTGKFNCSACDMQFTQNNSAHTHYRNIHLKLKNFTCDICDLRFSGRPNLARHHQSVHLKLKAYRCDDCGKQFVRNDQLLRHRETVHLKVRRYKCPLCERQFSRQSHLTIHHQAVHLKLKLFPCDQCDQTLSSAYELKMHVYSVHLGIEHECDRCGKKFARLNTLRVHGIKFHPKPKHT